MILGERVAVAMSGGVDSSVAAAILKEQGYDIVGFSMQLWDHRRNQQATEGINSGRCCSIDDLYDARSVAARLQIPYYVVQFEQEFEQTVIRPFIEDYCHGLTPSPCVLCNSHLKFDRLLSIAQEVDAARVATGHYARILEENGRYLLLRARDSQKDQSYFLFELKQEQLARTIFPLGNMGKKQVRDIAHVHGLAVADKQESQEICFVPDGDYARFIENHYQAIMGADALPASLSGGDIVNTEGVCLGRHRGVHHFTIGQRRGLSIAHSSPLYVIALNPDTNQVIVGERSQLERKSFRVTKCNWIAFPELEHPMRMMARIRSRHRESAAMVSPLEEGGGSVLVDFESPQPAITPGQACVFYQDEKVLGGGWIAL